VPSRSCSDLISAATEPILPNHLYINIPGFRGLLCHMALTDLFGRLGPEIEDPEEGMLKEGSVSTAKLC
jgi:hypothetical protein